jgi:hypothetical protein
LLIEFKKTFGRRLSSIELFAGKSRSKKNTSVLAKPGIDDNSIHKRYRDENLKGSTVTARACLAGATFNTAGGL